MVLLELICVASFNKPCSYKSFKTASSLLNFDETFGVEDFWSIIKELLLIELVDNKIVFSFSLFINDDGFDDSEDVAEYVPSWSVGDDGVDNGIILSLIISKLFKINFLQMILFEDVYFFF